VGLIRSWNDAGWIRASSRVGDKIGRLIGAPASYVVVADSTSVNVFKLLHAALALRPDRTVVLSECGNFPTDLYVAEGVIGMLGGRHSLRTVPACELAAAAVAPDVAVLLVTAVNYHTGARHDMARLTSAAHEGGALVLWDLAHSAGAEPLALQACGVDFAVGCGYKFLNGGPGAPAFLYVSPELAGCCQFGLTGWLGHAAPFAFEPTFRAAPGVAGAIVGTPPILSLAALECGVDLMLTADLGQIRAKAEALTACFIQLQRQRCPSIFRLVSPEAACERGSQVSLGHEHAYAIVQALIARGVIGDFRSPDVLRFGFTPLYTRFADVWHVVEALAVVMEKEEWRQPRFAHRHAVT